MKNRQEFIELAGGVINFSNIALITEIKTTDDEPKVFHQRTTYGNEFAFEISESEIRKSKLKEFSCGQYGTLIFINPNEIVAVTTITDGGGGCNIALLEDFVVWVAEDKNTVLKRLRTSCNLT